ncbi:oxygenase MpaB family protein [Actinosynnema sp. NPDC050801]|uniref:oxygenase MpaB family protein n=1 Tax=unclassified Actinosynnema TaxID=2637065 RepID=UPI00340DF575
MSDQAQHAVGDEDELGVGSASWRYLGRWRLLLVAHRALVLQGAHPAVGAAISQFSVYTARPWRRLFHTLDSLQLYIYGTQAQRDREITRLERLHRRMRGVDERGRPFTASDPAARMWVHLTLFDSMLTVHRLGGDPLPRVEAERLYAEWRALGHRFGITDADLPSTLDDFTAYFDRTVDEVLEDNAAVRDLLFGSIHQAPPPPGVRIPQAVWAPLWRVVTTAAVQATVTTLPAALRRKLGITTLPGFGLVVLGLHHAVRVVMDALPEPWRYMPYAAASIKAVRNAPRLDTPMDPAMFFTTVLDQTGEGRIRWNDLLAMARELSVHLDLDEADENEVHAAFESWWDQLRDATGGTDAITFTQYQAAVTEGRYPGDTATTRGVDDVVDVICRLIDRDGNSRIPEEEYARLFTNSPKRHEIITDLRALDRNGNGLLDIRELAVALHDFFAGRHDFAVARELLGRV